MSIKCSRFPGSSTKLACFEQLLLQLWVSLPGCFLLQLLTPSSCPFWTNCFSSFLSLLTQFPSFSWWNIPARILLARLSLPFSSPHWLGLCYSCNASISAIKSLFITCQKGKTFFQITNWLLTTRRWGANPSCAQFFTEWTGGSFSTGESWQCESTGVGRSQHVWAARD